jgi:hypothetical protein
MIGQGDDDLKYWHDYAEEADEEGYPIPGDDQ